MRSAATISSSAHFGRRHREDQVKLHSLPKLKRLQFGTLPTPDRGTGAITMSLPDQVLLRRGGANRARQSYASIVYGTRKCKRVRPQQGACSRKRNPHRESANRSQLLESESDSPQLVRRHFAASLPKQAIPTHATT